MSGLHLPGTVRDKAAVGGQGYSGVGARVASATGLGLVAIVSPQEAYM